LARQTNDADKSLLGGIIANFLEFVETIAGDYDVFYPSLRDTLKILRTVTYGAIALAFGYLYLEEVYVAPKLGPDIQWEVTISGIALVAAFVYVVFRIRKAREHLEHMAFHMAEAGEMHVETVLETESVDFSKPMNEQILMSLRKADFDLDFALQDSPQLAQFDMEVAGKKTSIKADIFVGVPWESGWRKFAEGGFGHSKFDGVWIALRRDETDPMSVADITSIREKLSDVLSYLRPSRSQVYVFSSGGFSPDAIKFVEDEESWIPHWNEGEEEEISASIDLVKINQDGRLVVVTMPWMKTLREERLAASSET
jgi:hypothetical protein